MSEQDSKPWECISTELGPDLKLFQARFDLMRNPRNSVEVQAVVLESPDWVNIVALTPDQKVVVVRQYRFGTGKIGIEIPAGIVDPGETSRETAVRELREETGYTTEDWEYLGYVEPNPAFLNNVCHHWLANDVQRTHKPGLDEGEDLLVDEMGLEEIRQEITTGRMRHSLSLIALCHVFDLWP
jgi:8-oxo-dGTP pyrophosphatase MutT (NUDIX family)